MRFLNLVANKIFSFLFTWLLGQRFTDTHCGTKVLYRSDYLRASKTHAVISATSIRSAIDRICGASRLSLKIIEVPIRYANRTYGSKLLVFATDCRGPA
jgi:hypothetical protein